MGFAAFGSLSTALTTFAQAAGQDKMPAPPTPDSNPIGQLNDMLAQYMPGNAFPRNDFEDSNSMLRKTIRYWIAKFFNSLSIADPTTVAMTVAASCSVIPPVKVSPIAPAGVPMNIVGCGYYVIPAGANGSLKTLYPTDKLKTIASDLFVQAPMALLYEDWFPNDQAWAEYANHLIVIFAEDYATVFKAINPFASLTKVKTLAQMLKPVASTPAPSSGIHFAKTTAPVIVLPKQGVSKWVYVGGAAAAAAVLWFFL